MKNLLKTVLKFSLATIILFASLSDASATATVNLSYEAYVMPIKRVVVTGNVNVLILQSEREFVKMENPDMDKVAVKQLGSTLTISSSEDIPVTVFVYVRDIYRIDASGKANVKTSGKFNVQHLQVLLKDEATARIRATTESLYTAISGCANLELIGTCGNHEYKMTDLAKMDTDKFVALRSRDVNTFNSGAVSVANNKTGVTIK